MSRRTILNVSSIKKQDNMISFQAGASAPGSVVFNSGPSNNPYCCVFFPASRVCDSTSEYPESSRQRQTIYARGYKETADFLHIGNSAWRWRRICFTSKGLQGLWPGAVQDDPSRGMSRVIAPQTAANSQVMYSLLFKGTNGVDWLDPMTAKVDTQRVTLKYDRIRVLNQKTTPGSFAHQYKFWFPMNKNLVFNDDEDGEIGNNQSYYSTLSKAGMGDYIIVDLFESTTTVTTDSITFSPQGTFYWHEK